MKKLLAVFLIPLMAVFLVVGSASAIPTLYLYEGTGASVVVADGDALDLSALDGVVVYNGMLGNFTINVSTGITKPVLGSADFPRMDLNSVNATTGDVGGSLIIYFSETDFTLPDNLGGFVSSIGGTTDGYMEAGAWLDGSNMLGSTSTLLAGFFDGFGPGAFSDEMGWSGNPNDPFSLTLGALIEQGPQSISSFDLEVSAVPEPATMLLLGSGLIGLAGIGRKKFFK